LTLREPAENCGNFRLYWSRARRPGESGRSPGREKLL